MMSIEPYEHVDGIRFGESSSAVLVRFGAPDRRPTNRRGEEELCYANSIWRFRDDHLVECTVTLRARIRVRDQQVSSFRAWLPSADKDVVKTCGFLVSRTFGVAVDLEDEQSEYISIFEHGRWDHLL